MNHDAKYPRNEAHGEPHRALFYAPIMAGAEGCGPAVRRTARLAQDDELADFLLRRRVQGEVSEEARRRQLGSLSAPEGEEQRAIGRSSSEADGLGGRRR